MQVTRSQAARALETVRRRRARTSLHHRPPGRPRPTGRRRASVPVSPMTIDRALHAVGAQPRIRVALVEAAAARLAAGERPSAEAVAEMAIRRATCDLLG